MGTTSKSFFFVFFILQAFASSAMSQEMVSVLVPAPNSPIATSSGVYGSLQCTKNSDESYAVCASSSGIAIKYNLQPFSFAAKGPNQGDWYRMSSCDLFETSSQSTSRAVCVKGNEGTNGIVYFHRVSDMKNITNVSIGITWNDPRVIVDTPNQVSYISNFLNPPVIFKISNIGSSSPTVAATLTSFGSGDYLPAAMLIIDGFLYVHFEMDPARLARIHITTFTWSQTVTFASGESHGSIDNLANDDNFIYDLTYYGILVRCTYKNNNFARFDSLDSGFSHTLSLSISPDSTFLLFTASSPGIILVNTSTFSIDSHALLRNAFGRPIILSKNNNTNTYPICAFTYDDYLYTFNVSRVPFGEVYPIIYPLPSSPIKTSSGVQGSLQCTKNSDESYAVCASYSNIAIKYNLQPFSFAAKGPNQGHMYSCDLYETASQSTSRAVCVKGTNPASNGIVYFHRVSDMTVNKTVTIGRSERDSHVIVDTPNQVAYISNYDYSSPAIFKITSIGSPTPIVAGNLTSFGSGDYNPAAMLIIDGFLYVHFDMYTASRLARINISTFKWKKTVIFANWESDGGYGVYDNLANDNNFIYYLTYYGVLVRCTYTNNNFTRFDSLNTGFGTTFSLAISPDQRTLFVVSSGISLLQMVDVASFTKFGNTVDVPNAFGRPIVTSSRCVYAFSQHSDYVYAFRYSNPTETASISSQHTRSVSISSDQTTTLSTSSAITESFSVTSEFTETQSTSSQKTASSTATPDLTLSTSYSNPTSSAAITESRSISNTRSVSLPNTSTITHSRSFATHSSSSSPSISNSESTSRSSSSSHSPSSSTTASRSFTTSKSSTMSWSSSITTSQSTSTSVSASMSRSTSISVSAEISTTESQTMADSPSLSPSPSSSTNETKSVSRTSSHSSSQSPSISSSPTKSLSASMSISSSISISGEITATESETIGDCSKIVDENHCHSSHCQWCHDLAACVRPTDDCSSLQCSSFSNAARKFDANLCPNSTCHFCPKTRTCLNRTENPVCSCAVASTSSSACGNSEGQCFWCKNDFKYFGRAPNSVKLCVDNETNRSAEDQLCSCQFLPKDVCTSSVTCAWCESTGGCFDTSVKSCDKVRCTDFTNVAAAGQCPSPLCQICDGICVKNNTEYAGDRCSVKYFDQTTCEGCHNCTWNEKVLAGVNDAQPYCVMSQNAATCPSPLTCSSINLPGFDRENQCLAAGCKYDTQKNECVNLRCFSFFLDSWVIQPLALMIIGFIKDVVMLLLFGVFGDVVLKILKRKFWIPFKFWKNKWDKNRIKVNLERTIYVNDSKARDFTSDKSESFEAYCEKIAEKFFELPETNDEEIRKDWKRRIVDAVTFAMFDTGLWFDLDDDGYGKLDEEKEKNPNGVEALTMNDDYEENENENQEQKIEQKQFTPRETEVRDENDSEIMEHATVQKMQENYENQLQFYRENASKEQLAKKLFIPRANLQSRHMLQQIVTDEITEHATCVLYFASSRVTSIRAATALNSFPSPLQLFYYLLGIVFLVTSSLASVLNYENQAVISRIASYSCTSSNSTSSASSDVGVFKSTYLILGFRLMNASTVATVFLVLVKTVRAIWASYGGRFNQLQLPQRLPIMGLFTKRSSQILLGFYFGVVLIFALAGLFYGFKLTASLKVIGITLAIFVGDALLLKLIRFLTSRFQEKDLEEQGKEINVEEEELASRLDLHVNFDQSVKQHQQPEDDFDAITVEEVIHVKKQSRMNSAPTSLPQALLVFLLAEEFPTILLTISLQLCYNYMCLVEYKSSFGFTDENMSEISSKEYESRSMTCIWELLQNDVSGYANVLSSFVAFL